MIMKIERKNKNCCLTKRAEMHVFHHSNVVSCKQNMRTHAHRNKHIGNNVYQPLEENFPVAMITPPPPPPPLSLIGLHDDLFPFTYTQFHGV